MTRLLTAAQMRTIEQQAIASGDVTGLELMERAGRGVVEAIFDEWPDLAAAPCRTVVMCGPGNNGGDGFVVARLLKEWGWEVAVFLYGDADRLPPDAKANCERWATMGEVGLLRDAPRYAHEADLFVDALFGTGLGRPLEGEAFEWAVDRVSDPDAAARTVAVDMPSGLCSDSGRELVTGTETVLARLTVSFHAPKLGHYLDRGPFKCGKMIVKDIGLEGCPAVPPGDSVRLVGEACLKQLGKPSGAHKFTHGHALILSGGPGATGAARLAARGALRIGAGLVSLGVPPAAQQEVACQITALMLARVGGGDALAEMLQDERINALCLGPGMGAQRAAGALGVIMDPEAAAPRPTVIDADALTALARDAALMTRLHDQCILTPHGGEFARLFPDIAARLAETPKRGPAYSKVDATRDAAERAGCFILHKGPDTVIAGPTGQCAIHSAQYERAASWLATAGAGDVLAGFVTGLLARGFPSMQAAETAAWLHVECARSFGPGLIAEDIPEELPKVFRALWAQAASERT